MKLADIFDRKTTVLLVAFSGLFSLAVIVGLLWYGLPYQPVLRFDSETVLSLREQFKTNPNDENLKNLYRLEDLRLRQTYNASKEKLRLGGYLLFGVLWVFALSLRRLTVLNEKRPKPRGKEPGQRSPTYKLAGIICISLPVAGLSLWGVSQLPEVQLKQPVKAISDSMKWSQFLGNAGLSRAEAMNLPTSWDTKTNKNILWKIPSPLPGKSSPIVWGQKIFLTGSDGKSRKVFCYDRDNGNLLWECAIKSQAALKEDPSAGGENGYAVATPITDGRFVYAFFGTAELAAVDFDGKQVWSRWFGKPDSPYGLATSPRYYQGKIILQLDQGAAGEGKSFLYAIDPVTGEILWKTPRDLQSSWSTPIVISTGTRDEIVTTANPWVVAYSPEDGSELWRAKVMTGEVAPSPTFGDGLVFTGTEYAKLSAVEVGGSGDVTQTKVRWSVDESLPDVATPVTDGKRLLATTSSGTVNCFDAKTGKVIWTQDFRVGFWSSPILIGDVVYATDLDGKTSIFKLGDSYQLLGEGNIGEEVHATPAFVDSKIYIRTKESLLCVASSQ